MTDRSDDARYLMNNGAWVEAMTAAKRDVIAKAMTCDPKDDLNRFRYLEVAKALDKISAHVGALIVAGDQPVDPANYYEERAKKRFGVF